VPARLRRPTICDDTAPSLSRRERQALVASNDKSLRLTPAAGRGRASSWRLREKWHHGPPGKMLAHERKMSDEPDERYHGLQPRYHEPHGDAGSTQGLPLRRQFSRFRSGSPQRAASVRQRTHFTCFLRCWASAGVATVSGTIATVSATSSPRDLLRLLNSMLQILHVWQKMLQQSRRSLTAPQMTSCANACTGSAIAGLKPGRGTSPSSCMLLWIWRKLPASRPLGRRCCRPPSSFPDTAPARMR
jgi:hypothetical protein